MTSLNAAAAPPPSRPLQPILTITTLKNWVLPPRPKNARKKVPDKKKKLTPAIAAPKVAPKLAIPKMAPQLRPHQIPKQQPSKLISTTLRPSIGGPSQYGLESVDDLHSSIKAIDRENYQLKTRLLSLIHDYKSLRALVLRAAVDGSPTPDLYDLATTARKRLYTEMGDVGGDPMSELIVNMNELSHTSPTGGYLDSDPLTTPLEPAMEIMEPELFDFVNLDSDFDDLDDDHRTQLGEMDDDLDSRSLSRSISPSASDTDENLLMASLTRSTTVSTNNSTFDRKPIKFYDLPSYSEDNYGFSFEKIDPHDKMMSVIEEDHYNQVADFLEEKLMSNDVQYYVEKAL